MVHHEILSETGDRWLFCLHGFLGSGRNLGSFAKRLQGLHPEWRPVLVDLPGHGSSSPVSTPSCLKDFAEPIHALIDSLAPGQPVDVMGHSLGGRTALALAKAWPESLARVVLLDIAPGPVPPQNSIGQVMKALEGAPAESGSRSQMGEYFHAQGLPKPLTAWLLMNIERNEAGKYQWRIDRDSLLSGHGTWSQEDLWSVLETPGHPVRHCIRGGGSSFVSEEDKIRFEKSGCKVSTLPGVGHFLHAEKPQELAELVVASL